jgi:hypothetical protein
MRKHPPLTAAADDTQNRIANCAAAESDGPSVSNSFQEIILENMPLPVCQISGVLWGTKLPRTFLSFLSTCEMALESNLSFQPYEGC